jgi:hypothetical protein
MHYTLLSKPAGSADVTTAQAATLSSSKSSLLPRNDPKMPSDIKKYKMFDIQSWASGDTRV